VLIKKSLIIKLIAAGKSGPEIAKELNRSLYTVRAHTRSIIEKFDVHGRVAAVAHARNLGIVK
jgi:LuxR family maltose regulon positive regulatory protein